MGNAPSPSLSPLMVSAEVTQPEHDRLLPACSTGTSTAIKATFRTNVTMSKSIIYLCFVYTKTRLSSTKPNYNVAFPLLANNIKVVNYPKLASGENSCVCSASKLFSPFFSSCRWIKICKYKEKCSIYGAQRV